MEYFGNLKESLVLGYRNKRLVLALFLQAAATIIVLGILLALGVVAYISTVGMAGSFAWNGTLIALVAVAAVVLLVAILLLSGWFNAGIYGLADAIVAGKPAPASASK